MSANQQNCVYRPAGPIGKVRNGRSGNKLHDTVQHEHLYVLTLDVSMSEALLSTQAQGSAFAPCSEQLPSARYAPRAAGTRVSPSRGAAGFRAPVCIALSAAAGCRRYPVPGSL